MSMVLMWSDFTWEHLKSACMYALGTQLEGIRRFEHKISALSQICQVFQHDKYCQKLYYTVLNLGYPKIAGQPTLYQTSTVCLFSFLRVMTIP